MLALLAGRVPTVDRSIARLDARVKLSLRVLPARPGA
jgi:hypothetical protein